MADLTATQRLEVIRRARKLLGPKGKFWVKDKWRYKKLIDDKIVECYCVEGAIDEAMCRLGFKEKPANNARAAKISSFLSFLRRSPQGKGLKARMRINSIRISDFNDQPSTRWNDVEKLLQGYMKELRTEIKAEEAS